MRQTILLALMLTVFVSMASAKVLSEAEIHTHIKKYIRDIHNAQMRVGKGQAAFLLCGFMKPGQKEPQGNELVMTAAVGAKTGVRGTAIIAAVSEGSPANAPKIYRGSVIFNERMRLPRSAKGANQVFERYFGERGRSGILGNRSFTKGDEGGWFLGGSWSGPNEEDPAKTTSIKVLALIAPDKDDPSTIIIAAFSEVLNAPK